jgi:nucleoside-diphosphate-sugar epimerase
MATLVTGASGCIGAWVLYHLVKRGEPTIAFDITRGGHRIDQLLTIKEQQNITFVQGDISDFAAVKTLFDQHPIDHVIHLAALQVPLCRADPVRGAQVNVVGTVNIFETARRKGLSHIAYASSIAVFGAPEDYEEAALRDDAATHPRTLYGVYKQANEATARVYFYEHQVSSIGLRPYTVYGVGRDQGLTSDPTKAMLHAVAGKPYHINFGGRLQLQLASDTALQFIEAATHPLDGPYVFNMGGQVVSVEEIVTIIRHNRPQAQITHSDQPLPFPEHLDDSGLRQHLRVYETPLDVGIHQTMSLFADLIQRGQLTV